MACGKQREVTISISIPGKTAALIPELVVEDLLRQNYSLGSCACSEWPDLRQTTLVMMMIFMMIKLVFETSVFTTERDGFKVTHDTQLREVPDSIPVANKSDYAVSRRIPYCNLISIFHERSSPLYYLRSMTMRCAYPLAREALHFTVVQIFWKPDKNLKMWPC